MPQGQLTTYSARDLNGTFTNPLFGTISLSGIDQEGLEEVMVRMETEHARVKISSDGAAVPSYVAGENGRVTLKVWQTSTFHQQLLVAYNLIKAAADAGNVSQAFGGLLYLSNTTDGSSHTCTGVGILKVPDKSYQAEAQTVEWELVCCNIINE